MPTNWKREESKGCPAAASARPTPGRRSQTARTAATPAGPERRPRCGSPERLGRGSAAHRPRSLCLHPNQRVAHRHAGSTRVGGNRATSTETILRGCPWAKSEHGGGTPRVVRDGAERFLKSNESKQLPCTAGRARLGCRELPALRGAGAGQEARHGARACAQGQPAPGKIKAAGGQAAAPCTAIYLCIYCVR